MMTDIHDLLIGWQFFQAIQLQYLKLIYQQYLSDNFFSKKGNVARKGDRFNTNEDYEINFGKPKFLTREIEAYQIYLTKLN